MMAQSNVKRGSRPIHCHLRNGAHIALAAAALSLFPVPGLAHDAFGDLGPFYASLLHPLADPLQAALLFGTAAFLAGRPLGIVRIALPFFVGVAIVSAALLLVDPSVAVPPIAMAVVAVLTGLAAVIPAKWAPAPLALCLVAVAGALTGLAPGAPPDLLMLQPFLGTIVGIMVWAVLSWFAFDAAGREVSPLVPQVAGSWVAAVGILTAAFAA